MDLSDSAQLLEVAPHLKRAVLRSVLTRRHCPDTPPFLRKLCDPRATAAWRRVREANLAGVGLGLKEVGEKVVPELAIRVYVTQKLAKSKVLRRVQVPESIDGIPTDVIQVEPINLLSSVVPAGASISHERGRAGSAGCAVRDAQGRRCLLSASHVLAPLTVEGVEKGDAIVHPGNPDDAAEAIGELLDFEPLSSTDPNRMDAGIALQLDDVQVGPAPALGPLQAPPVGPGLQMSVSMAGAKSLLAQGQITDLTADRPDRMLPDGRVFLFDEVFEVWGDGYLPFAKPGDSGALIVESENRHPVGVLFGGDNLLRAYATPIQRILDRFSISIEFDGSGATF